MDPSMVDGGGGGEEDEWLRVHSADLPFLVAEEAARAFDVDAFCDVIIKCKGGEGDEKRIIKAHSIVLAATSPFLKKVRGFFLL